jgi:hypothetical protein
MEELREKLRYEYILIQILKSEFRNIFFIFFGRN